MEWYDLYKTVPDPTLAEFQTWQRPRDLIGHLSGVRAQGLVNGLLQRLENGFLFAAAGISSWRDEKTALQKRFAPVSIQAGWWEDATGCRQHWQTLWTLGDIGVRVYDMSRHEFIDVALTAIRFEASSLYDDETIPRPPVPVPVPEPPPRQASRLPEPIRPIRLVRGYVGPNSSPEVIEPDKPKPKRTTAFKRRKSPAKPPKKVDAPEFLDWVAGLSPDDRAKSFRWLREAAGKHFAPRSVPKKFVLELVDGRPRGRRRKEG